jgi:hypothetical protein
MSDCNKLSISGQPHFSFVSPIGEFRSPMPIVHTEEDVDPGLDGTFNEGRSTHMIRTSSVLVRPKTRVFEDFYIFGCTRKDFSEFDSDSTVNEGIVGA